LLYGVAMRNTSRPSKPFAMRFLEVPADEIERVQGGAFNFRACLNAVKAPLTAITEAISRPMHRGGAVDRF
jgi:hypothetical protein